MAIRMMTTKEAYEARETTGRKIEKVSDYSGHEEGLVRHDAKCPHYNGGAREIRMEGLYEDCLKGSYSEGRCDGPFEALYMETTYEGLVVGEREMNGYDDSDFYAVVWDAEAGRTKEIMFGSTRGWTYPNNAWVDATPEVLAAYKAWRDACEKAARERYEADRIAKIKAALLAKAKAPAKGAPVKVVKGRKVPKGTVGECFWIGENQWGTRVGIKDAAGTVHWTAAANVECIDWETVYKRLLEREGIPA